MQYRLWILVLCLMLCIAATMGAEVTGYFLTGKIDGKYGVQMNLHYEEEGGISGTYYYESTGQPLIIGGGQDKKGVVTLTEEATIEKDGEYITQKTGTFIGKLTAKDFIGLWISEERKQKLPFALTVIAEYRYMSREVENVSLWGVYPYFANPTPAQRKLSQLIYGQIKARQNALVNLCIAEPELLAKAVAPRGHYDFRIHYADESLVSLSCDWDENDWGVHPNNGTTTSIYLLDETTVTQQSLSTLFNPKTISIPIIETLVNNDLTRQKKARGITGEHELLTVKEMTSYTLSPTGITFIFSPYVTGSYAEGYYYVTIPYADLNDYINPQGPLMRFVEKADGGGEEGQ